MAASDNMEDMPGEAGAVRARRRRTLANLRPFSPPTSLPPALICMYAGQHDPPVSVHEPVSA